MEEKEPAIAWNWIPVTESVVYVKAMSLGK